MSQGPLCPNLTKNFQKEVSQMANRNLSRMILLGGLSVNLNHLKSSTFRYYVSHVHFSPRGRFRKDTQINLFLSFSCRFRQKCCQVTGWRSPLWSWHPLGNFGSAIDLIFKNWCGLVIQKESLTTNSATQILKALKDTTFYHWTNYRVVNQTVG